MNTQKGFVVPLLIAIIAILIIGGGIYIYNNKKAETPSIDQTEHTFFKEQRLQNCCDGSQQKEALENLTADWKTYTNSSLKYSVKYPPSWYAGGSTDESIFIRNWKIDSPVSLNHQKGSSLENINIEIVSYINATNPAYINVKDEALADWTKEMTDKQNILVDGIKAVKGYSLRDGEKVGAVRFVFDGKLYFIDYDPYNSKLESTFDQILSTFKFTK